MRSSYEDRSRQVARYVKQFADRNGYPPSGDEIAAGLDVGRTYVYLLLDRMEKEGLIERPRMQGRAVGRNLRLTRAAMKLAKEQM
jgi:DNA-binding MarR family transcriptional regulator